MKKSHLGVTSLLIVLVLSVAIFVLMQKPAPKAAQDISPRISYDSTLVNQTIYINANVSIEPADGRLVGFAWGSGNVWEWNNKTDAERNKTIQLLDGLRPTTWRFGPWGAFYEQIIKNLQVQKRYGTKVIWLAEDAMILKYGRPIVVLENNRTCESWAKHCYQTFEELRADWNETLEKMMQKIKNESFKIDYYDIINEPEWDLTPYPGNTFGLNSQEEVLTLFKDGYGIIKRYDPDAKISGPAFGLGIFGCGKNANASKGLETFLNFIRDNNITLNAFSWHEYHAPNETDCNIPTIVDNADKVRELFKQILGCTNDCPELHVNEYHDSESYLQVGRAVGYLYYLAMAKVDYAMRGNTAGEDRYGIDFGSNGLDGLLTKDETQPLSLYWIYTTYANMTGDIVSATSDNVRTVALTSYDPAKKEMKIIAGRYDQNVSANVVLRIAGFASTGEKVKVKIANIPPTGNKAVILEKPVFISEEELIAGQELSIPINDFRDEETYIINLNII